MYKTYTVIYSCATFCLWLIFSSSFLHIVFWCPDVEYTYIYTAFFSAWFEVHYCGIPLDVNVLAVIKTSLIAQQVSGCDSYSIINNLDPLSKSMDLTLWLLIDYKESILSCLFVFTIAFCYPTTKWHSSRTGENNYSLALHLSLILSLPLYE